MIAWTRPRSIGGAKRVSVAAGTGVCSADGLTSRGSAVSTSIACRVSTAVSPTMIPLSKNLRIAHFSPCGCPALVVSFVFVLAVLVLAFALAAIKKKSSNIYIDAKKSPLYSKLIHW